MLLFHDALKMERSPARALNFGCGHPLPSAVEIWASTTITIIRVTPSISDDG